jgi:hypothetical protein
MNRALRDPWISFQLDDSGTVALSELTIKMAKSDAPERDAYLRDVLEREPEAAMHDEAVAAARAALGPEFDAVWSAGAAGSVSNGHWRPLPR